METNRRRRKHQDAWKASYFLATKTQGDPDIPVRAATRPPLIVSGLRRAIFATTYRDFEERPPTAVVFSLNNPVSFLPQMDVSDRQRAFLPHPSANPGATAR